MASDHNGSHQALVMKDVEGKPGKVWFPLQVITVPTPTPSSDRHLLVRPTHLSLNHRDVFLRQRLYPSPSFTTPLLSDACAEVVSGGSVGGRVLLNPGHGWVEDPLAPEKSYAILGGTSTNPVGLAQEFVLIDAEETAPCPEHLSGEEAASLPLVGLTGWRALVTKSGAAEKGCNILITGIGGGVATIMLAFAVAKGVRVWVTSGDPAKIDKARKLGAQDGVNYKDADWDRQLKKTLPEDRPYLDAVIDGAGADIVDRSVRLLKPGGAIVSYGMTVGPKMQTSMSAVLKHIDIRASTMGSRREFKEMVEFVARHRIRPVVSRVVEGALADLNAWEDLYGDMKAGRQFGKLVFRITSGPGQTKL